MQHAFRMQRARELNPIITPLVETQWRSPRSRVHYAAYNGDACVNATNKFPTSADERNSREFTATRHCRIMLQQESAIRLHLDTCISARWPRACVYARAHVTYACVYARARIYAVSHPRVHAAPRMRAQCLQSHMRADNLQAIRTL